MKLEGITLSEISQTKRNTAWRHLHVKCKKKKKIETTHRNRVAKWLPMGRRQAEEAIGGGINNTNFQLLR